MKPSIALLSVLGPALFVGCATGPRRPPDSAAHFQEMLDTWKGKDINDLIYAWGPPSSTFAMPNGNKMFTWAHIQVGPTVTTGSSLYLPSHQPFALYGAGLSNSVSVTPTWDCYTTAITGSSGTISGWKLKGNSCVMGYTDKELRDRFEAIRAQCGALKKGVYIKLTFYDGAEDALSRKSGGKYGAYFERCDLMHNSIQVRAQKKRGGISRLTEWYLLNNIESIVIPQGPVTDGETPVIGSPGSSGESTDPERELLGK